MPFPCTALIATTANINNTIIVIINAINVIPFSSVIKRYAVEKVATDRQGTPVADFDLLIGCSALENDLIMVTDNVKHFQPIQGIKIENWIDR